MTTIIKINKSSIKKNPKAGQTIYSVPGMKSIEYEYKGGILPEELCDGKHAVLVTLIPAINSTDSSSITKGNCYFGIILDDGFLVKFIKRIPKTDMFKVNYRTEIETIETPKPAPKYLYKYEDAVVTCNECLNEIKWNEIPLSGDFNDLEYCPKCNAISSFDYEFESIADLNLS